VVEQECRKFRDAGWRSDANAIGGQAPEWEGEPPEIAVGHKDQLDAAGLARVVLGYAGSQPVHLLMYSHVTAEDRDHG
jgi:hypothetical protein